MMSHLTAALDRGEDIGHYGRLVFAMVARHFLDEPELVSYLARNPGFDEVQARALVKQVQGRDYNPPKREKIMQFQREQAFPICPTNDPTGATSTRTFSSPRACTRRSISTTSRRRVGDSYLRFAICD